MKKILCLCLIVFMAFTMFGSVVLADTVLVNGITITGHNGATGITAKGGTLQMDAAVSPDEASDKTVTWSVDNGNATIDSSTGMLTAAADGTVTVTAAAADGSGVTGTCQVTISGQSLTYANGQRYLFPVTDSVNVTKDVQYYSNGSTTYNLDIYTPADNNGAPDTDTRRIPVIFMHGSGDTKEMVSEFCTEMTKRGFVVFPLEYPGSTTSVAYINSAIAFIQANAAVYGVDPNDIVLGGFSNGGRSSMNYVFRTSGGADLSSIKAVLAFSGGGSNLNRWPAIPVFFAHGDQDTVVAYSETTGAKASLDSHGVPDELFTKVGGSHELEDRFLPEDVIRASRFIINTLNSNLSPVLSGSADSVFAAPGDTINVTLSRTGTAAGAGTVATSMPAAWNCTGNTSVDAADLSETYSITIPMNATSGLAIFNETFGALQTPAAVSVMIKEPVSVSIKPDLSASGVLDRTAVYVASNSSNAVYGGSVQFNNINGDPSKTETFDFTNLAAGQTTSKFVIPYTVNGNMDQIITVNGGGT